MSLLLRSCAAALVGLPLGFGVAFAGSDCRQSALDHLRAAAPDGYAIYTRMRDKDFFNGWISCDDAQFDLPTAVHESTHLITSETDAFPLVGGGAIARPHEVSTFFPPSSIAKRFKADDFTTIYLRLGQASSSTDFLYLLDELNAYTHDLATAVDLKDLKTADEAIDHRDGLAAMMAFVAVYAQTAKAADASSREARTEEAQTWAGLRDPRVARTIAVLWGRAEGVMASSCGIPDFGSEDRTYIQRVCTADAQAALEPILGRAPVCPTACLTPATTAESDAVADLPASDDEPRRAATNHRSIAGPSWIRAIIDAKARDTDDAPATEEAR